MSLESSSITIPTSPIIGQTYDFAGKSYEYIGNSCWKQIVPAWQEFRPKLRWICLTSDFTLISQTALQNLFPGEGIRLPGNTTYQFDSLVHFLTNNSTGSVGMAFSGTAALTRQRWQAQIVKFTIATRANTQVTNNTTTNADLDGPNNQGGADVVVSVRGQFRVGAGGTVMMQMSQTVASVGPTKQDSYFAIWPLGPDTARSSET